MLIFLEPTSRTGNVSKKKRKCIIGTAYPKQKIKRKKKNTEQVQRKEWLKTIWHRPCIVFLHHVNLARTHARQGQARPFNSKQDRYVVITRVIAVMNSRRVAGRTMASLNISSSSLLHLTERSGSYWGLQRDGVYDSNASSSVYHEQEEHAWKLD